MNHFEPISFLDATPIGDLPEFNFVPVDISKMELQDSQRPHIEETLEQINFLLKSIRKCISKFRMNQKLLTKLLNNNITESNRVELNQFAKDFANKGSQAYEIYTENIKISFDQLDNFISSVINDNYRLKCQTEFESLIKVTNKLMLELKDTILMLKILERKTSSEKRVRNLIYTPEQLSQFMNS